jgi:hypothetical protein
MRYPLTDGETSAVITEYHIITPRGQLSATFEDKKLAQDRFAKYAIGFKLVEVQRKLKVIGEIVPQPVVEEPKLRAVA